jgi:hypothetical protein
MSRIPQLLKQQIQYCKKMEDREIRHATWYRNRLVKMKAHQSPPDKTAECIASHEKKAQRWARERREWEEEQYLLDQFLKWRGL